VNRDLLAQADTCTSTEACIRLAALFVCCSVKVLLHCVMFVLTDGSTAVHRACFAGNYEALWILIQYHADVSVQDNDGRAPVHWASIATTLDCLQVSDIELRS